MIIRFVKDQIISYQTWIEEMKENFDFGIFANILIKYM